jgi:hypothetical protein
MKGKYQNYKRMFLENNRYTDSISFVDNQILLAKNEDDLQHNVTNLNQILQVHDMRITTDKMKAITMEGKHVR